MKRAKHIGTHAVNCPVCITSAEIARNPWQTLIDVFASAKGDELQRKHNVAIARHAKDEAMRSIGMVKVKGALGGTYYE